MKFEFTRRRIAIPSLVLVYLTIQRHHFRWDFVPDTDALEEWICVGQSTWFDWLAELLACWHLLAIKKCYVYFMCSCIFNMQYINYEKLWEKLTKYSLVKYHKIPFGIPSEHLSVCLFCACVNQAISECLV